MPRRKAELFKSQLIGRIQILAHTANKINLKMIGCIQNRAGIMDMLNIPCATECISVAINGSLGKTNSNL